VKPVWTPLRIFTLIVIGPATAFLLGVALTLATR
jgi:hypothetical protein